MSESQITETEQNTVIENHQEDSVEKLHKIFGEDSIISTENDLFLIDLTLKNAMCPGGQRVKITLEKTQKAKDTYQAKELLVENTELLEILKCPVFFQISTEKTKKELEKENITMFKKTFISIGEKLGINKKSNQNKDEPDNLYLSHIKKFRGTKASDGGYIVLVNFEDADGLAAILHERGHLSDKRTFGPFSEIDSITIYDYFHGGRKDFNDEEISEARTAGENILKDEMYANKVAIQIAQILQNKDKDIFKGDDDLFRMKKFLVTMTSFRFWNSQKFVELLGMKNINSILDFGTTNAKN